MSYPNNNNEKLDDRAILLVRIAKYTAMCFMVIFVFSQFFGGDKISRASMEVVAKAVISASDMSGLEQSDNQMIRRLYGLAPNEYEACALYSPIDNMDADEILIVKCKDISQKNAVVEAMEKRRTDQIRTFEGYGPEQVALLKAGIVKGYGNYCIYIINEKADDGFAAFKNSL